VIRRSFRIGLWLGLLAGLGYAVLRVVQSWKPEPGPAVPAPAPAQPWTRLEVPEAPPAPTAEPATAPAPAPAPSKTAASKKVLAPWVDPDGDVCPATHPVKAKLSSKIFQVEGNFAYDRTRPDRCYESPTAAENDGFRAAKR